MDEYSPPPSQGSHVAPSEEKEPDSHSAQPISLVVAPPFSPTPAVPGKHLLQAPAEGSPSRALNDPRGHGEHCDSNESRGLAPSPCVPLGHGVQSPAPEVL